MKIVEMLRDHDNKYKKNRRYIIGPKLATDLQNAGKARIVGDAPGKDELIAPVPSAVSQEGPQFSNQSSGDITVVDQPVDSSTEKSKKKS